MSDILLRMESLDNLKLILGYETFFTDLFNELMFREISGTTNFDQNHFHEALKKIVPHLKVLTLGFLSSYSI